jgi:hypothetical protein
MCLYKDHLHTNEKYFIGYKGPCTWCVWSLQLDEMLINYAWVFETYFIFSLWRTASLSVLICSCHVSTCYYLLTTIYHTSGHSLTNLFYVVGKKIRKYILFEVLAIRVLLNSASDYVIDMRVVRKTGPILVRELERAGDIFFPEGIQ